ncbi:uncharacterized protein LOC116244811 [Nymphaea colorata]|uniref:uncharacterized protein LOC116244811 n=1 Tax=Nymphaea colorata TaxID=210225 RepID=UPI00129E2743|nr:uncharacterized protein LOC116244811 [Nymphaea colorata]
MAEKYLDIKKLAGKFRVNNLNEHYEILGESAETVDTVIDNFVTKRLNDMQGLFVSIHYTDLKTFTNSSGHLRVVLNANHKNPDQFLPALEVVLYIADKVAGLKLTANAKARALKAREAYNQLKEKEELEKHNEELRKKKEEKLRQEDAWIRSLPPEKQKREEEKRKKKELNKMMKGKVLKM